MTESNFDDAIPFAKGHGTENDFIILPDPDAALNLTPEFVRQLCDRRAGLGGDGVLRVVRSKALVDAGWIKARGIARQRGPCSQRGDQGNRQGDVTQELGHVSSPVPGYRASASGSAAGAR